LAFALGAALLSSLAARREKYLEAFIGLLYAFGVSGVFILLSRSPHGMEEFQNLLASDILFTSLKQIIHTAILYGFLGLFLFFINRKTRGFIKEFSFFATFAFVVTSSVQVAGVFVVFALLIGPAFTALKLCKGRGNPLFLAWVIGVVVNIIAITVSYRFDLPTGYTIVLLHALTGILFSFIKRESSPTIH
jgi:zinc/manganese transport system permease protein